MFKYEVEKDKDTESTLRKVTLFKVISLSVGTSRFVAPMITFYVDIIACHLPHYGQNSRPSLSPLSAA